MSTDVIEESGMLFGPYPDGHCFHIENSELYRQISQYVPIAEFALLRETSITPCSVWIIEAKSSSPRPETLPGFPEFIEATRKKLVNALTLTISASLGRQGENADGLPEHFKNLDLASTRFRLVLVVNGHQTGWCVQLQEALQRALRATVKTWALGATAVAVINDVKAVEYGLISGKAPVQNSE